MRQRDRKNENRKKKKKGGGSLSKRVKSDGVDLAERESEFSEGGIPFCCSRSLKRWFP